MRVVALRPPPSQGIRRIIGLPEEFLRSLEIDAIGRMPRLASQQVPLFERLGVPVRRRQ